ASFLRAYANLANEMGEAGYAADEARIIRNEVAHYEHVRNEVKLNSGDYIDLKMFEPAMRHLLDSYIRADDSRVLSSFDEMSLVDLLVERGPEATQQLPEGIREDPEDMAETIENNVRRLIIDESPVNPKYYEHMSELLDALIEQRRSDAPDYESYLQEVAELARQAKRPTTSHYPPSINTPPRQALHDTLAAVEDLADKIVYTAEVADPGNLVEATALAIDDAIRRVKKSGWR